RLTRLQHAELRAYRRSRNGYAELGCREERQRQLGARRSHERMQDDRTEPKDNSERDERGMRTEVAEVQRRTEPDEEDRTEEALGDGEELLGQPSWFANRRDSNPVREPGQHDRDVRLHRKRRQCEQDREVD